MEIPGKGKGHEKKIEGEKKWKKLDQTMEDGRKAFEQ